MVTGCGHSHIGGDRWYNARPDCLCFKVALVVHQHRRARARDVADALGIPWAKAYEALIACAKRSHIYHLHRSSRGEFFATSRR
jgi:hypothetical protein